MHVMLQLRITISEPQPVIDFCDGLDYLVIENQVVSKKEVGHGQWMSLL